MIHESKDFSEDMSQSSNTRNRPICIKAVPPVKKVHFLETRFFQSGYGCHAVGLVKQNGACLPSLPPKSTENSPDEPSENNDCNCTNMARTTLVLRISKITKEITISDFLEERSFGKFIGSCSSISTQQDSNISCVDYFRINVCHTGILKQTSSLISSSRIEGSLSNWLLFLKKCSSCYTRQEVDPRQGILVNFLAECFSEGNKCFTIGCFRLSILAYHAHTGRKPLGQHPLVYSLMTKIFNNLLPKQRHLFEFY